jgi:outer membrane protein assembly factor BamB
VVFRSRATTCSVVALIIFISTALPSGQQPKRKETPPPFALLPAEQAWLTSLDAAPSAGGAMDAERVFVPLQSAQTVGIDRQSGALLWTRDIDSAWPPIVGDGVLYVATKTELHALSPANGVERWRVPIDRPLLSPLTYADGLLLTVIEQGDLLAWRSSDGQEMWRQRVSRDRPLSAPVAGEAGTVYLTFDGGEVMAVATRDGSRRWNITLPGRLSVPAFARHRVLVGNDRNDLYALDADSGSIQWKWRVGGDVIGAAADADDRVYFASLDNLLRAVNRGNGNQRWRKVIDVRPAFPPTAINDVVVLTGVTPVLTSYSARNGAVVGTYRAPEVLKGPPLIDAALKPFHVALVVITRDGRVIGLRPTAMLFREPTVTPLIAMPGIRLGREPRPQ